MKRVFLMLLLAVTGMSVIAQEKITVGVLPFTYVTGGTNLKDVAAINEEVTKSFVKTNRFNVVDRSKMDALKQEKELQKTEDFMDGSVIEQGKSLGAEYLIGGHVSAVTAEMITVTDANGRTTQGGWKARLSVTLKVINVSTGEVISSETIEPRTARNLFSAAKEAVGIGKNSKEEAIADAINGIQGQINRFVLANFPITSSIVQFEGNKVLITGGTEMGMRKDIILVVYEITQIEVGGKQLDRKKEIGRLKVANVEDENFSTCDIKSGEKEIKERFNNKANLVILTEKNKKAV